MPNKLIVRVMMYFVLLISNKAHALEPYDNYVVPDGSYFLMYPVYYKANTLADENGDVAVNDLNLRYSSNVFRYAHAGTTKDDGKWLLNVLLPVVDIDLLGEKDQGIGDLTLGSAYWLINHQKSKTWLVIAGFVDFPTGDYDSKNTANVGLNVWKFRPSLGLAKQYNDFDLEVTYRYNIYSENEDIDFKYGSENILESYLGYSVTPKLLFGIHYNIINGSDNETNGSIVPDSAIRKNQLGVSFNYLFGKGTGITTVFLSEFNNENSPEGDTLMMRLFWKI